MFASRNHGTRGVGIRRGPAGGAKKDKVVIKVAVHFVPDAAAHVADPSEVLPFMNCTIPVGLAPVPVPWTVALKVTLPPPAGRLVEELVTVVVVARPVTVKATAAELLPVKLGSPLYCATTECDPAAKVEIPGRVNASAAWLITTLLATGVVAPLKVSTKVTVPVGDSGLLFATVTGLTVACRNSVTGPAPLVKGA
jgi:hypothetical protein